MLIKITPDIERAKSLMDMAEKREDGFRAIGEYAHKEAIDYLSNYGFSHEDLSLLHDLRIRRNKSMYEGKQINPRKLKTLLKFKIKESEK